jgi:hypothetical protein
MPEIKTTRISIRKAIIGGKMRTITVSTEQVPRITLDYSELSFYSKEIQDEVLEYLEKNKNE